MTLRADILALLSGEYAGQLDAGDLAHDLGVPVDEVQRELHAMTRAGLLLPRAYRLYPHPYAATQAGLPELHQEILRALVEKGPLSRAQLGAIVRGRGASGSLKRALSDLFIYAQVSPPSCPWVKP